MSKVLLRRAVFAVVLCALTLLPACGGGGGNGGDDDPPREPGDVSVELSANPTTIAEGQSTKLTWNSSRADTVVIEPDVGAVSLNGSVDVSPRTTTTYRATATGGSGQDTDSVEVTVTGPVSITFEASPATIEAGGTATLNWTTNNADSVTIDNGIGSVPVTGSQDVSPSTTTTYRATATGPSGPVSATATVQVVTGPPTISITASPMTINAGDITTITWNSSRADTVTTEPEIEIEDAETFPLSGSAAVVLNETTTYVATATNAAGTSTAQVTITVNQVQPTVTLTASPENILPGESSTLSWSSEHAESINISGIGSVEVPSGSRQVNPSATTTYTATASGAGGTGTSSATVNVASAGELAVSLTASTTETSAGTPVTLRWNTQNAASVSMSPSFGNGELSGEAQVTPDNTTTYTVTASDGGGNSKSASVTVTVVSGGSFNSRIKHIIFFMQENRSFNHYFGMLGRYRESKGLPNEIDGLNLSTTLTDFYGHQVQPFHARTLCMDVTSPGWNESHFFAHKKADGTYGMDFWLRQRTDSQGSTIDPHYTRSMAYLDQTDLPYYYELATQFATSDRFFASMLGPTIPNRMYLFTGTSFGHIRPDPKPAGGWTQKTIFELLNEHNVRWRYYYQDSSVFLADFSLWNDPVSQGRVRNIREWYTLLADPNADNLLPPVVFIEQAAETQLNEHPSNRFGPQPGAANTKKIIDALMNSTAWKSSVFILLYDEAGGLYDHVPPVPMPKPDNIEPMLRSTDLKGDFSVSGFRVPFIVISPWVKKNYVSHVNRDFGSVLKFIETRFGLPALTERDRQADNMLEMFDFNEPSWLTPPPLPEQPTNGVCNKNLEVAPGHP